MDQRTSNPMEEQMDSAQRQTHLSLPNNSVEESPPIPPSQVSTSVEEVKKYNIKQTLQVIDDDVDAPIPLEIQNPLLKDEESKKCEEVFLGGRKRTMPLDHTASSTSRGKAASSNFHTASDTAISRNQDFAQSQAPSQNSSLQHYENEGINPPQNSLGRGSSQHTSTLQNNTPNSVAPFFAVEATLVENSVPNNGHFPDPSAPMRGTPVINAVIVDSSRHAIGNDDENMSEKSSMDPDPTVSFWRRHRTFLVIGVLLVIIGALVGSIVSIVVVGNNGGEPTEAMAIGSTPTQSSGGSSGESTKSLTGGPSPLDSLNPTSSPTIQLGLSIIPSPTLIHSLRDQSLQPTTQLTKDLTSSPMIINKIPSSEPLKNPSSIPRSEQPTSTSSSAIPFPSIQSPSLRSPTEVPTKKPTAAPNFSTLAPISSSQSTPNPSGNPTIPLHGDCWSAFTFDNFESGIFPNSLWATSGSGAWMIDDTKTIGGSYSIRSPDLSNLENFYSVAQSNATIVTCTDFSGGSLLLNILAGFTSSSVDFLHISIDGRRVVAILDGTEDFYTVSIPISSGRHFIDFSYNQNYIIPNLSELFPSISEKVGTGAIWLDNVSITPSPAVAKYSPCLIGYCEVTLSDECFMKYKLNATEESLSVELFYNGIGWLGWGISDDGAMDGSEAVM